jgi:hypothetical protein
MLGLVQPCAPLRALRVGVIRLETRSNIVNRFERQPDHEHDVPE